jgi:hypothetical protein
MHWCQVSDHTLTSAASFVTGVGTMMVSNKLIRATLFFSMSYAEVYLTISRIVRQYDFELHDTSMEDLDMTHARIVGYPKHVPGKEFLGEIRVKVLKKNLARV